jgi:hypothetical protein
MQTRQNGAAHVPIMFFLILLVMFLGALAFAYVSTDSNTNLRTDNAKLRADVKAAQGKQLLLSHYIEDLGAVLQLPGKYTIRPEVSPEVYEGGTLDGITGVADPKELKTKLDTFGSSLGLSSTRGLEDLFSAAVNQKAGLDKRIADLSTERDAALAAKNATDSKFTEATTSHSRASNEMRQTLEQTRADFESGKTDLQNRIGLLQQNVRDRDTQIAEEKESRASERKGMQNQIGKLQMHNTALVDKDKMRVPPSVADGSVLVTKSGLNSAFINLGKRDMLQPGTIFQIKNLNSASVKAYATVTRVEDTRAEVTLSGIVDPVGDPVRDGDAIYNDLYSPGQSSKRTIFLLGRFSYPYHKPQLTQLLENLGNRVVAKMGPGVDTVILGDDAINEAGDGFTKVEESEEYKAATMLGVEFVPMRKIRDIVKP